VQILGNEVGASGSQAFGADQNIDRSGSVAAQKKRRQRQEGKK